MSGMKIGVVIQPRCADYRQIRAAWVAAEAAGADSVFVWDHFYPPFDDPAEGVANFECWSLLAAMAEATERVRIGPLVSCVPFRNPHLIADLARTVDHICGGRLILGLGPGWYEHEFTEYGYPFNSPGQRLAEFEASLKVIRSRLHQLSPPPLQSPIPIVIGSKGQRVGLRLVARYADIWHAPVPFGQLSALSRALDEWCRAEGRHPGSIERWTAIPDDDIKNAAQYQALGFSQLILDLTGPVYDFGPLKELLSWRDSL
jgi:probable F420-dependent oxidoreductase